jgi:hypothetical protein
MSWRNSLSYGSDIMKSYHLAHLAFLVFGRRGYQKSNDRPAKGLLDQDNHRHSTNSLDKQSNS